MVKFREDWKVVSWVFDKSTLDTLEKLKKQGYDIKLIYPISMGKEASVFLGKLYDEYVAVKIYAIESAIFKNMLKYILGDPRFPRFSKRKRVLIKYWVKKEYLNLLRAWELGINCPKPITYKNNILVMEFIGKNKIPAPKLKDYPPESDKAKDWLTKILNWVRIYWNEGNLVHGDLSEYNILNYEEEPYIIDFSLGVLRDNPISIDLLKRDIKIIIRFFNKSYRLNLDWIKFYKKIIKNEPISI